IIDDICAKIGTTNVDRRSFSHDSEMDLVMVDGAVEEGARALALRLRLALWGEHLNLPRAKRECLKDYKLALSFWLSPPAGARICPYNVDTDIEAGSSTSGAYQNTWDHIVDPDGGLP